MNCFYFIWKPTLKSEGREYNLNHVSVRFSRISIRLSRHSYYYSIINIQEDGLISHEKGNLPDGKFTNLWSDIIKVKPASQGYFMGKNPGRKEEAPSLWIWKSVLFRYRHIRKADIIAPVFTEQTAESARRNTLMPSKHISPSASEKRKTPFSTSLPLGQ